MAKRGRGNKFIPPQELLDALGSERLAVLSQKFDVSKPLLNKLRRERGIKCRLGRPVGYRKPYVASSRDLQIKKYFEAGETLEQIGAMVGLTKERVRQIAKRQNLKPRGYEGKWVHLSRAAEERHPTEKMVALYSKGLSCKQVGIKLGISPHTVHQRLKKHGIEMRHAADYAKPVDKAALKKAYDRGLSFVQLAELFDSKPMTVHRYVVKYGFKLRGSGRRSEQRKGKR